MAIYFKNTFFRKNSERPPALRAARAPVLDIRREVPRFESAVNPSTKTRAISSNFTGFLQILLDDPFT